MAVIIMPHKTPGKGHPDSKKSQPLTLTPGTRFWLTLVDATYTGPEEDAPEPQIVWVEVHSVDKRKNPLTGEEESAVIAKLLLDPSMHQEPVILTSIVSESNQFLDIKIKAEYAQDTLGKTEGTGPYFTDVSKPNATEIPPGQHPREL
jgi:hypothetical protein